MIVSFRCSPDLKRRVDALISDGRYPDFSTLCVVAIENQVLLEEADFDGGSHIQREHSPRPSSHICKRKEGVERSHRGGVPHGVDGSPVTRNSDSSSEDGGESGTACPELSLERLSGKAPFPLAEAYADVFGPASQIPPDRFLFGQYNRLLPAKVSCRALAVLAGEGKDALALERVAPRIAEVAARFGIFLRKLDRQFSAHRDDALATAFPEEGPEGQKGRLRYQNHFVGHTMKGEQGGLLVGLKLMVIQVIKNKPHILPTAAGWEFASLRNPLLDASRPDAPVKFSDEEIIFLLNHIRQHVPAELLAYRMLLSLISAGCRTPESLTNALLACLEPKTGSEEQRDFVSTQRTGVIGRTADLGLVSHERNGTRITYSLTSSGERFLDQVGQITVSESSLNV